MMLRSGFAIRPGELINIRFEKPLYASGSHVVASKVVWCRDLEAHGERFPGSVLALVSRNFCSSEE